MALSRPKLVAAAIAVVVLAGGAATVIGLQKSDKSEAAAAGGPGGGPGGGQRGPGGPGGPGGGRGGPIQVTATPVAARPFINRIDGLGTLEPRERVTLTANAADRVTGVYFEDGQRVSRGKTLVTLVNDEETAQLESAKATASNAKLILERNKRLSANDAIAQLELERSQTAAESADANVSGVQARLRDRVVLAPFDGVLGFRQVSVGAFVSPGQPIATLIDDSQMRLEFGVPQGFVTDLRPGLAIEATTPAIQGRNFTGELTSIDNAIDPVSRSVKVRATIPNRDGLLKAGMFMSVNLSSRERSALAIPEISVVAEGSKTFVYVVSDKPAPIGGPGSGPGGQGRPGGPGASGGRPGVAAGAAKGAPNGKGPPGAGGARGGAPSGPVAVKTEVIIGARERGSVEVVSGLKSGDLVVTDGVLKLRPNAPVRVQQRAPGEEPQASAGDSEKRLVPGEGPSDKAGLRQ